MDLLYSRPSPFLNAPCFACALPFCTWLPPFCIYHCVSPFYSKLLPIMDRHFWLWQLADSWLAGLKRRAHAHTRSRLWLAAASGSGGEALEQTLCKHHLPLLRPPRIALQHRQPRLRCPEVGVVPRQRLVQQGR